MLRKTPSALMDLGTDPGSRGFVWLARRPQELGVVCPSNAECIDEQPVGAAQVVQILQRPIRTSDFSSNVQRLP